jgi:gliding motility-associated-like protein
MAFSHCTMVLRDSAKELYHMHLSWLSYEGWMNNLSHYEVFRKVPGSGFTRIAIVDNNKQTYVDSFLCDMEYCYYVEAVHRNRRYRSRSNISCGKPLYKKPVGSTNIQLVTIENDSFPSIRWNSNYRFTPGSSFQLERSGTGNPGSFGYALKTTNLSALDRLADAKKAAYFYRVVFKDHCGEAGSPGSISNSIYLKGIMESGKLNIDWNDYAYWVSGVKEYKLQVKQKDGLFADWFKFMPGQTEKTGIELESFGLDTIYFRVLAVKDSTPEEYSVSNTAYFIPTSYLLVPTAFSPNADGLNDVFKPYLGFIQRNSNNPNVKYAFSIYNRWGQRVFETSNPDQGWNGKYLETYCPAGVYVYQVTAVGLDGVPHRIQGTVYLSR